MQFRPEAAARAPEAEQPSVSAGRRRWVRVFRPALAGAVTAVVMATGVQQLVQWRARAAERVHLAEAAAADRRARDDQLRVWSTALASDPASSLALAQLAALNIQKARESGQESYYPIAEQLARRSLTLRTQRNAKTYVVLASSLLAQHRFAEARAAAAAALSLEPDVAQYRALVAELDMELGDYPSAARGFAGLQKYRTHLSIGPRLARWAEVTGEPGVARETLEKLIIEAAQRPDLPREQLAWFHFRLGDHYRRHGSPRRARMSLARALAVNPGDYRAHKALAELELARGAGKSAVRHARKAVRASRTPETLLTLARALRQTADVAGARAIEAEVAADIGEDGGSFERAWHAYRLEFGLAPASLTALLDREARLRADVQGYDLLAWAHYKANRIGAARAAAFRALRTGTSDAAVWYHAGVIFHASGDLRRARECLLKALDLNPSFNKQDASRARSLLESMGNPGTAA